MINAEEKCLCGHAAENHDGGGYCAAEVEGGVCGCDNHTPAELDKEQFWKVALELKPDMTRKEFDAEWDAFQAAKNERNASN